MANREEYNACMRPYLVGSKPKEQRRLDFCIGAKVCSGKAKTDGEAKKLCDEAAAQPKNPKPEKKGRKVCTLHDLEAISVCVTENVKLSSLTTENMQETFAEALKKCSGAKATTRIISAKKVLETLDPQQLRALELIAQMTKEGETRQW